jgi:ribonuclease HI
MIHVWTDGSCKGNPGPSGVGVLIVLPNGSRRKIGIPLGESTNNRAELHAVRIALEELAEYEQTPVTIYTDSQNVIGWLTGVFRVKANVELVREIQERMRRWCLITFVKVLGHSGDFNNEVVDQLAQCASAGVMVSEWEEH